MNKNLFEDKKKFNNLKLLVQGNETTKPTRVIFLLNKNNNDNLIVTLKIFVFIFGVY